MASTLQKCSIKSVSQNKLTLKGHLQVRELPGEPPRARASGKDELLQSRQESLEPCLAWRRV